MTDLRLASTTFAATAALLLASLAPRVALAQSTCADDGDCEQGFECTVVGGSACGSSGAAAPAPSCPPGETCEMPEPPAPDPCEPMEIKACTPAACTSDAQCAEGMVCHAWAVPCATSDCACSSDVPDCDCGPQPVCMPETKSMCTPRYLLPCQEAADCGSGFTCEQQAAPCACSGGGAEDRPEPMPGAGAAGSGFAPPEGAGGQPAGDPLPNPEPCVCEPTNVFACVPQEIECANDAECPAGWQCEQENQGEAPSCPPGTDCKPAAPLPPARSLCRPEYYGGGGVDVGLPAVPGSDPAPTTGNPASGPKGESGGENPAVDDGEANESAACQFGRAPASSGALSLLAVLGALFGLKRRRRA